MKLLTDEEIGKEFKVLWRCKEGFRNKVIIDIKGYFDKGQRATKLIKSLEVEI